MSEVKKLIAIFIMLYMLLILILTFVLIQVEDTQSRLDTIETKILEPRTSQTDKNDTVFVREVEALQDEFKRLRVDWETTEAKINNFDGMFKAMFE